MELNTIIDFIRFGASRFSAAGLSFSHSYDNALDEATQLVLHALHLPHDLSPVYGNAKLVNEEKARILAVFERRIETRTPACYLTGEAWFAGLSFKCDARALIPRSPLAELIESGFEPYLDDRAIERVLDLCTGSGCIAIAIAHYQPHWQVDAADISAAALALAQDNLSRLQTPNVRLLKSDLFHDLGNQVYDLIVSNPPYVTHAEIDALPSEFAHEPDLGLRAGVDGLDLALEILRDAPAHLSEHGVLICEVGESEGHLRVLLPALPLTWIEFKVGAMGVFIVERESLLAHHDAIAALAALRR